MPLPIALIVDDGTPATVAYGVEPEGVRVELFPSSFTRAFGQMCQARGVKGKFTVMPVPARLGRIDQKVKGCPQAHLREFISLVKKLIAPNFDITPEFLTHGLVMNLAKGGYNRVYEDDWADRAGVKEMTDYFALAMRILDNVGLRSNGVTSPWMAGIKNERRYAEAVGRATWRVYQRRLAWYFLHILDKGRPRWPWVTWRSRAEGLTTVMVPTNTNDPFWAPQGATSARALKQALDNAVEKMLTADGKSGRIREIFDAKCPIVLLSHWQSLYSNGRCTGLAALEKIAERVERIFGDQVQWMKCSELAALSIRRNEARGKHK
ncbi:MAG: hypothetical protein HZA50_02250 [Planctomycetes bacterium]|nr:hypothetical protein [Planctomycetota bacterium]